MYVNDAGVLLPAILCMGSVNAYASNGPDFPDGR
uniref:Uncharacterized protein n=1 Tax=Anguilla anguilla TaxID=7936 RepID=A0A0E9U793_ANGAN